LANVSIVNVGQVQILWMQDLSIPFSVRERFAYCKAEGRWEFSGQSFNNGIFTSHFLAFVTCMPAMLRAGIVFGGVFLSVCASVCPHEILKSTEQKLM